MSELKTLPKSDEFDKDHANVQISPVLFFIPLILAFAVHYLVWPLEFSLPQTIGGWITHVVIGGIVGSLGFGIQGLTIAEFRKTDQEPDFKQPTTSVIYNGPYQYSRNPMYLGAVLIYLGVGIGTGSIWILAALTVAAIMAHFLAILPEEQYLERKFGTDYLAYKSSVRRWL